MLGAHGVQAEERGGDVQIVRVSALKATVCDGCDQFGSGIDVMYTQVNPEEGNLDELVEAVVLQADLAGVAFAPVDVPAEAVCSICAPSPRI